MTTGDVRFENGKYLQPFIFPRYIVVNGKSIPVNWLRLDSKVVTKYPTAEQRKAIYDENKDLTFEQQEALLTGTKIMEEVFVPVPPPQYLTPEIMRHIYDNELRYTTDGGKTLLPMDEQAKMDFNLPVDTVDKALGKFSQEGVTASIKNEFMKRGKEDWYHNPQVQNYLQQIEDKVSRGEQVDYNKVMGLIGEGLGQRASTSTAQRIATYGITGEEGRQYGSRLEQLKAASANIENIAKQAQADMTAGKLPPSGVPGVELPNTYDQLRMGIQEAYQYMQREIGAIERGEKKNEIWGQEKTPEQIAREKRWAGLVKQAKLASSQPQKIARI